MLAMTERPLYVRLPEREADALDKAAADAGLSKRQLVTAMVQKQLGVGRIELRPADVEVLTLEQAALLLQTSDEAVAELAESGELPARKVGGEWRFSRTAILVWLGRTSS